MINPDTLKSHLAIKNWKQVQLAKASGVDKGTINRIINGKHKRSDSATVERIAKALGVKPEELAAPPPAFEHRTASPESRFETTLSDSTRNALALVARRYGMQPRVVLELAPALLVLAAERHLAERSANLAKIHEAMSTAEAASPYYLNLFGAHADWSFDLEQRAIAARDLFLDRQTDPDDVFRYGYEFETHAPFPTWIQAEFAALKYGGTISWFERDWPARFTVSVDDAIWLAESDRELADDIASGYVALHKLKGEERTDPQLRLAALRRLKAESDSALLDFNELIGPMLQQSEGHGEAVA